MRWDWEVRGRMDMMMTTITNEMGELELVDSLSRLGGEWIGRTDGKLIPREDE